MHRLRPVHFYSARVRWRRARRGIVAGAGGQHFCRACFFAGQFEQGVGGTLTALWLGKNDPGFVHNGPLAGLVAVCAGSDVFHPIGALIVGGVAGALFVVMFTLTQNRWKIDDVLGVWSLHGLCGTWGGIAAGLFGAKALGGVGGVSFMAQLIGTLMGIGIALAGGFIVYGLMKKLVGIRLDQEEEFNGADLSIHKISATPERESGW